MRFGFEIPSLPKTTNAGGRAHWALKAKEAKVWKAWVLLCVRQVKFKGPPLQKARLTLIRYSSSEPDFDGLVSSFKHVIDGLVDAKVLVSDKQSVIGQPTYLWEYAPPKKGFIRVHVEPVEVNPEQ